MRGLWQFVNTIMDLGLPPSQNQDSGSVGNRDVENILMNILATKVIRK